MNTGQNTVSRANAWFAPGSTLMLVMTFGILALAVAGYLIHCYQVQGSVTDDAYISWRFARNLAEGYGLVWNVGGEPVEGYTTTLWVLVLALANWLGFDIQNSSYVVASGSVLATAAILVSIVRHHMVGVHPWLAVVIGIYLVDRYSAVHSFSGMETQLFVLTLAAMTALALRFVDRRDGLAAVQLAMAMAVAIICRPDAVVFIAGTFLALGLAAVFPRVLGLGELPFRLVAGCTIFFSMLVLIYGVTKYSYFGYLLPNSYYVKSGVSGMLAFAGWQHVKDYLSHLVGEFQPLWIALFLAVFAVLRPRPLINGFLESALDAGVRLKALVVLLPAITALAYYATIIHEVGFSSRFSYPTFYLVIIAMAGFTHMLIRHLDMGKNRNLFAALLTGAAVISVFFVGDWRIHDDGPRYYHSYHARQADALANTGLGSGATVTTVAAGLIPYRSRFNQVDPVGLVDNFLSGREFVSSEEREAYLWSRASDVYLGREPPASPDASGPDNDPVMKTSYVDGQLLHPESYTLQFARDRSGLVDPQHKRALLYSRMSQLRDNWILLGEMVHETISSYSGLRTFVYVRRGSPHAGLLASKLQTLVDVQPGAIRLDEP